MSSVKPSPNSFESFSRFALAYGRHYLAAGGPSNRLEDQLATAAERRNLAAEVYATPTGLFMTVSSGDGAAAESHTVVARIKEYVINLNQLCWLETLLDDVINKKITYSAAYRILQTRRFKKPVFSFTQRSMAAFALGVAVSYPTYSDPIAAIFSGLITFGAFWIIGPLFAQQVQSGIFRDFIASFFTLFCATILHHFLKGDIDSYTIGAILLLVPGLTITTAISELADQNFISGTAKLMKGVLTLLSISIAYILFQELSFSNVSTNVANHTTTTRSLIPAGIGTIISVFSFSIIFQVPRKALIWSTGTGFLSWMVFRQFQNPQYYGLASFLASLTVGLVSLGLGSWFKTPSQIYSVPGVLALLPGMMALSSFRSFAAGSNDSGIQTAFQVTLVAGTIVFGLFFARVPFAITGNLLTRKKGGRSKKHE